VSGLRDDLHGRRPRLCNISSRLQLTVHTTICKQSRQLVNNGNDATARETAILHGAAQTERAMSDNVLDLYFDQGMLC
jgi:hypothetical protein